MNRFVRPARSREATRTSPAVVEHTGKKKHRAVLLTWRDSCSYRGWNRLDDKNGQTITEIISIGWIVTEDDHAITITTSIADYGSGMDMLTIPKECIVRRRLLPQYVEGR